MQKVLSATEMREVDRLTTEKYGIPSIILMENAAHAAANVIREKLGGSVADKSFLILCGKGNNGGDGAALGRILWQNGAKIYLLLLGKIKDTKGDAKTNFKIAQQNNYIEFREIEEVELWNRLIRKYLAENRFDCVIDAIFGTGLSRPVEGIAKDVIDFLVNLKKNNDTSNLPIFVSIDLPSGLNADSSKPIGKNFEADFTVTFTAPKLANVFPPASNFNGKISIKDIGSPRDLIEEQSSQTFLTERDDVKFWLEDIAIKPDSYKKTRGTALVVAGSKNYSGAAVLAANACLSAGAGMVTAAVPETVQQTVAMKVLEEIITRGFSETKKGAFEKKAAQDVLKISETIDIVALGCGLSSEDTTTKEFVREIVENRRTPIVLDADGLNALAPFDLKGSDDFPLVLTPHIGEFKRLLGTEDEIEDRIETAREFAKKHNVILVLKGERSFIAAPDGKIVINPTGNAGISRAGAGDTLTGIITGFIAQSLAAPREYSFYTPDTGVSPKLEYVFNAVVAAVYISGLAADIAAEKYGKRTMLASDVRACLGEAFQSFAAPSS